MLGDLLKKSLKIWVKRKNNLEKELVLKLTLFLIKYDIIKYIFIFEGVRKQLLKIYWNIFNYMLIYLYEKNI